MVRALLPQRLIKNPHAQMRLSLTAMRFNPVKNSETMREIHP
jgi:hypothetical protein